MKSVLILFDLFNLILEAIIGYRSNPYSTANQYFYSFILFSTCPTHFDAYSIYERTGALYDTAFWLTAVLFYKHFMFH